MSALVSPHGRAPVRLVVPAALALMMLVLPLVAIVIRTPWSDLAHNLNAPDARDALRLSLVTTSISAVICVVVGVPLAWVLARVAFRGRSIVRALVTLPLVLPPVVGGVALLLAFGRNGIVGHWLNSAFGITIPFTTTAVVMAQVFVALPFLVISVEGSLRASDPRFDDAAATLGASRWLTFRRVTVPMALPGILSGSVLSWARALGEFGATITFAGNFPGTTRTMPLEIYLVLQNKPDVAISLSLVLMATSILVLALLRERWTGGLTP